MEFLSDILPCKKKSSNHLYKTKPKAEKHELMEDIVSRQKDAQTDKLRGRVQEKEITQFKKLEVAYETLLKIHTGHRKNT